MRNGLFLTAILCCVVLAAPAAGEGETTLPGDESDGSRAVAVHLLELFEEEGEKIFPDDDPLLPFSVRQTCGGTCHNIDIISKGWHFNSVDPNIVGGRAGEPWIFVDAATCTQIPVSYRLWPGTFRPEEIGLTTWQFTLLFGRHTPGGGAGEIESEDPDEVMRGFVSGKLEVNCLACHNASEGQDQAEYATQVARQNFRWAAAGACEFASIKGVALLQSESYDPLMSDDISTTYRKDAFDPENQVLFDIVREVPNERCYFCHSNKVIGAGISEKWAADEDIHLKAGMKCVDCHRNGLGHNITRGYEGEEQILDPSRAALTCQGCHIEGESSTGPVAGRLGAPVAKHPGIPTVHFDRLSCTACHSGPWPDRKTYRVKTSRAHALGTHNVNKSDDSLPHIITPVFAEERGYYSAYLGKLLMKQPEGKIGPHNLIWPAFWGFMEEGNVRPVAIDIVRPIAGKIIGGEDLPASGDWPSVSEEQIAEVLALLLSEGTVEGKPVYISGGKLYSLDDNDPNQLSQTEHPAAEAYLWPIAHNVRPAAQSLGIRKCQDCHSTSEGFFFGRVAIDTPIESEVKCVKEMLEFQDVPAFYTKAFAMSFVFRPMLKIVAIISCAILGAVVLLYALKALDLVAKILAGKD